MRSCRLPHVWLLPVAFFSALGLAPAASAQNALGNPGFESGSLDPWQDVFQYNGGQITSAWQTTTDFVHSGQYAATCTGARVLSQTFALIATQSITQFSFWAASPAFSGYNSGFHVAGTYNSPTQGQNLSFTLNSSFPSPQYQFYDFTTKLKSNLPANAMLTSLRIIGGFDDFGGRQSPIFYVDDFTLTTNAAPVPEASTMASLGLLLTLGFGTFTAVAVRRRKAVC